MAKGAGLACVVLCVLACRSEVELIPRAVAAPVVEARSGFEVVEGHEPRTAVDRNALANLEQIQECIERERQLAFTAPLAVGFYDRAQFAEQLATDFFDFVTPAEFDAHAMAWSAFGFGPIDLDLATLASDSTALRLLGLYVPKRRQLQCLSGDLGSLSRMVMTHETVHALQDQTFNLTAFAFNPETRRDADRFLGLSAVIEGDAALATTDVLDACRGSFIDSDDGASALMSFLAQQMVLGAVMPPLLADGAGLLYHECESFVRAVRDQGGWSAVDALYTNPPRSSEQVLHPEKLLDPQRSDEPLPLRMPDLGAHLGTGWRLAYRNRLGEAGVRQLVRFTGDPGQSVRAAAGWGGDEYCLYVKDTGTPVLVWLSAWDSERDAQEMMAALQDIVGRQVEQRGSWSVILDETGSELRVHDGTGALRELASRDDAWLLWIRTVPSGSDIHAILRRCLP